MKATVLQENFNKGLGVMGRVITVRGQLPILGNVLVEAGKEGLTLSATNLEIGLRMEIGGKVTEEGAITVPAKNLGEFVGLLSEGGVDLTTEGEKLKIEAGKAVAVFAGIAAQEFPIMPKLGGKGALRQAQGKQQRFKVSKKMIGEVASQVAFAAAADESRPVLTGIKFFQSGEGMAAVATDGFRLSRMTIAGIEENDWGSGLILPARTLLELARLAADGKKEEVEMEKAEENNQVIFGYDKLQLVSRVLEGNFPEVDKIIPTEFKTQVAVDREEWLRAVRSVSIFARDNANIIRFAVHGSALTVKAVAQQTGESEIEMEAEKEGEDGEIAFNFRYLVDFLSSGTAERVRFKMSGSLAPGVFSFEGSDKLIHLIMPVRV